MARPILVALDFSEPSRAALDAAVGLARKGGVGLVVAHAFEPLPRVPAYGMSLGSSPEARARLDEAAAVDQARRLTNEWVDPVRSQGLDVAVDLGDGPPDEFIIEAARRCGAQAIVVGTHGWTGVKRMVLGSVAQKMLQRAQVPVMIVPTPG